MQIFKILDQQVNIKEIRSVINNIIKKKIRFQAFKSMKIKKSNNTSELNDNPISLSLVRNKLIENKNQNNEE